MAKKNSIYAPGELNRVRERLGVTDESEAKRIAQLLGGEVGTERGEEIDRLTGGKKPVRRETVDVMIGSKEKRRRVEVLSEEDKGGNSKSKQPLVYSGDDPSVPVKLRYSERVKIDRYAGQFVFEIKNSMQVFTSMISFFKEPVDLINPRFVTVRMNEYYNKIERLVTSARMLFPKNNMKRNQQLKRASPFVFKVLDTIRGWNIESLAKEISELQSHPRTVKATDFSEALRLIYKPLFILEDLNTEDIKSAFKLIYKILYIESPIEAKDKYQDVIRNIIAYLCDIRRTVHFGLYPLLMKLFSDRLIVYERFFTERRKRFLAFLDATEAEQLNAEDLNTQQIETIDVEALRKSAEEDEKSVEDAEYIAEEDPNDPKTIERKAKQEAEKAQQKTLEQSLVAMENIFPKAGWKNVEEFPDFYPYFANVYNMRHGYELIARTDPIQLVSVLFNILDDLFIGLRSVKFTSVTGPDGKLLNIDVELADIINNWRQYKDDSFLKDYLPRLGEYCRTLENSRDAITSPYAKKIMNELHWLKRLYFLPYYKFESLGPPPFPKKEVIPIYNEIRKLRKNMTSVAKGIESGLRAGGAAARAHCMGINNPWQLYDFQVPNPVSKRLDMMLPPERRINATLIFFSLSTITVLDHLINNENSWAYGDRPGPLFRSVKDEGIFPLFGVDDKLDADQIFKDTIKKAQNPG
ncbi:MAG: hypothetical protein LBC80_03350 [Treponema sp.]|jgi:hypothetical protein|nr:hypothetical protein [Treponema sp.]